MFLHPLPVGALWGSGRARRSSYTASVCGPWPTLRIFPPGLRRALGPAVGDHLADLAWGRDQRQRRPPGERSAGSEHTFAGDVDDDEVIHRHLLKLSDHVAARLRSAGWWRARYRSRSASPTSPRSPDPARCPKPPMGRDIYTRRALYDALACSGPACDRSGSARRKRRQRTRATHQIALDEPAGWRGGGDGGDQAAAVRDGVVSCEPA